MVELKVTRRSQSSLCVCLTSVGVVSRGFARVFVTSVRESILKGI